VSPSGEQAEQLAHDYLLAQGLTPVARNYRSRFGEIDLILRERDTLVFVEVRLRSRADFGGAAASITAAKRAKLVATASQYLAQFSRPPACRFDVVLLGALEPARIEWIKHAFDAA
jgi:putative endonuclease